MTTQVKRKLNTKRLYKLIKTIVIVVTIINAIVAVYYWYPVVTDINKYTYTNTRLTLQAVAQCGQEFSGNGQAVDSCVNFRLKPIDDYKNIANNSLLIAIFLPLLFFGGTMIYRYLFPKRN